MKKKPLSSLSQSQHIGSYFGWGGTCAHTVRDSNSGPGPTGLAAELPTPSSRGTFSSQLSQRGAGKRALVTSKLLILLLRHPAVSRT